MKLLNEAGIHVPSLEIPVEFLERIPTDDALEQLREAQKRTNYPGMPSPLASYLECWACTKTFTTPAENEQHKCIPIQELKCTGCGLTFKSHRHYKIHVLTFC